MNNIVLIVCLMLMLTEPLIGKGLFAYQEKVPVSRRLGEIKNGDEFDGCGCLLFSSLSDERKNRTVFLSDLAEKALINVNGNDVKLKLVNRSRDKDRDLKVGDRSWEIYESSSLKVRVDYIVTKVCSPNDESCEVTRYKATVTLNQKGQISTYNAIGMCGC